MKVPGPEIRFPFNWRTMGCVLLLLICFFGFLGVVARVDVHSLVKFFDLDSEKNFPTLFSALLLCANAWWVMALRSDGVLDK